MPCLADFASRRLPSDFIEKWDAWLQRSIAASRERLGERWLDVYLTSPMWRFVLGPGVCGDGAWAGLLVPSVDKVGRYFPLTFAQPLGPRTFDLDAIVSKQAWYAELERVALSALNIDYTVDALEQALAGNRFPSDNAVVGDPRAREIADWLENSAGTPLNRDFSSSDALVAAMHRTAGLTLGAVARGRSFWWCVEQQSGATELHCAPALPDSDYYAVLLGSPVTAGTLQ